MLDYDGSVLSKSFFLYDEYNDFRSKFSKQKIVLEDDYNKVWTFFDTGPKSIKSPIIFFPPISGTADIFFLQLLYLNKLGYRAISLEYPIYWSLREFTLGFTKLLNFFQLNKIHLFGASLGGFLAQKYAEEYNHCCRVRSIILCNSFTDTSIFNLINYSTIFWMMPIAILKKITIEKSFIEQNKTNDSLIKKANNFIYKKMGTLKQQELASRLTLNCSNSYVQPQNMNDVSITIIDVFDKSILSEKTKNEIYKMYPNAKRAHLKDGGNFPFLSRFDQVNMHIYLHLKAFDFTEESASLKK